MHRPPGITRFRWRKRPSLLAVCLRAARRVRKAIAKWGGPALIEPFWRREVEEGKLGKGATMWPSTVDSLAVFPPALLQQRCGLDLAIHELAEVVVTSPSAATTVAHAPTPAWLHTARAARSAGRLKSALLGHGETKHAREHLREATARARAAVLVACAASWS